MIKKAMLAAGSGSHPVCHLDERTQRRGLCRLDLWSFADQKLWGDLRRLHEPSAACDCVYPVLAITTTSAEAAATRQHHRTDKKQQ